MNQYDVVFICAIFAFAAFITYLLLDYQKPAEVKAEPVTTEIPEYVAKCTKHEITRNTCIEFTLYRITRN
jgi:hypothetical protein